MRFFIDNCKDEIYIGILLYQCNNLICERLNQFSEQNKLVDTYIIGLLKSYNDELIEKLGIEKYMNMIEDINDYYGGKKASCLVIKKGWMSQKNRTLCLSFNPLKDKL
jgi:hypothetical protein